eukprot:g1021.t1
MVAKYERRRFGSRRGHYVDEALEMEWRAHGRRGGFFNAYSENFVFKRVVRALVAVVTQITARGDALATGACCWSAVFGEDRKEAAFARLWRRYLLPVFDTRPLNHRKVAPPEPNHLRALQLLVNWVREPCRSQSRNFILSPSPTCSTRDLFVEKILLHPRLFPFFARLPRHRRPRSSADEMMSADLGPAADEGAPMRRDCEDRAAHLRTDGSVASWEPAGWVGSGSREFVYALDVVAADDYGGSSGAGPRASNLNILDAVFFLPITKRSWQGSDSSEFMRTWASHQLFLKDAGLRYFPASSAYMRLGKNIMRRLEENLVSLIGREDPQLAELQLAGDFVHLVGALHKDHGPKTRPRQHDYQLERGDTWLGLAKSALREVVAYASSVDDVSSFAMEVDVEDLPPEDTDEVQLDSKRRFDTCVRFLRSFFRLASPPEEKTRDPESDADSDGAEEGSSTRRGGPPRPPAFYLSRNTALVARFFHDEWKVLAREEELEQDRSTERSKRVLPQVVVELLLRIALRNDDGALALVTARSVGATSEDKDVLYDRNGGWFVTTFWEGIVLQRHAHFLLGNDPVRRGYNCKPMNRDKGRKKLVADREISPGIQRNELRKKLVVLISSSHSRDSASQSVAAQLPPGATQTPEREEAESRAAAEDPLFVFAAVLRHQWERWLACGWRLGQKEVQPPQGSWSFHRQVDGSKAPPLAAAGVRRGGSSSSCADSFPPLGMDPSARVTKGVFTTPLWWDNFGYTDRTQAGNLLRRMQILARSATTAGGGPPPSEAEKSFWVPLFEEAFELAAVPILRRSGGKEGFVPNKKVLWEFLEAAVLHGNLITAPEVEHLVEHKAKGVRGLVEGAGEDGVRFLTQYARKLSCSTRQPTVAFLDKSWGRPVAGWCPFNQSFRETASLFAQEETIAWIETLLQDAVLGGGSSSYSPRLHDSSWSCLHPREKLLPSLLVGAPPLAETDRAHFDGLISRANSNAYERTRPADTLFFGHFLQRAELLARYVDLVRAAPCSSSARSAAPSLVLVAQHVQLAVSKTFQAAMTKAHGWRKDDVEREYDARAREVKRLVLPALRGDDGDEDGLVPTSVRAAADATDVEDLSIQKFWSLFDCGLFAAKPQGGGGVHEDNTKAHLSSQHPLAELISLPISSGGRSLVHVFPEKPLSSGLLAAHRHDRACEHVARLLHRSADKKARKDGLQRGRLRHETDAKLREYFRMAWNHKFRRDLFSVLKKKNFQKFLRMGRDGTGRGDDGRLLIEWYPRLVPEITSSW